MQFTTPLLARDGIELLGRKTAVAAGLDSHDWQQIPVMLRQRALWSATVQSGKWMQGTKDFLLSFLEGNREEVVGPDGQVTTALMVGSKAQFVLRAREFALQHGLDAAVDPKHRGGIKDITSEKRLGLIFEVQTQSAWSYSQWAQGQDPDVLNEFPAQEFVRVTAVKQPRPIHVQNTGVIRLKSDLAFWTQMNSESIGGFGVPWGPWGFGSGMGVRDVDRDRAEQLGLVKPGAVLEPAHRDLNESLQSSVSGLDQEFKSWIKQGLGDQVVEKEGVMRWAGQPPSEVTPASRTSMREDPTGLTSAEQDAVRDYTGASFFRLNAELREGAVSALSRRQADTIQGALEKLPVVDGEVFRGEQMEGARLARIVPGNVLTWEGFTSTSKDSRSAFGANVLFRIRTRSGRDVALLSEYRNEKEVLLPLRSRFRVASKVFSEGRWHVTLDEL